MKKVKTFRFRTRRPSSDINLPAFPQLSPRDEPEMLTGTVKDMDASAPEERLARALDEAGINYYFRWTVGAPRGLPGWKEVDFIIMSGGLLYAAEVDTAFTHRGKEQSDILHDAIILNDRNLQEMGTVYPQVLHADGDSELANNTNAKNYVKQRFGR
jgi:hypothetical protein